MVIKYKLVRSQNFGVLPKDLINQQPPAKISSQFARNEQGYPTKDVIRGLSLDEEKEFLPQVLGISANSPNFDKAVLNYWLDYSVELENEIVFDLEKDKDERPVNLTDYINFNFVNVSSVVAKTKELYNPQIHNSYLIDLGKEQREKVSTFQIIKDARLLLNTLFDEKDSKKIDWVVDLIKEPNELVRLKTTLEKEQFVSEKSDKYPEKFIKIMKDKDLETKALLVKLLETNILLVSGNTYFYDDEPLGNFDEAIIFMNNAKNSGTVAKMKSKLITFIK